MRYLIGRLADESEAGDGAGTIEQQWRLFAEARPRLITRLKSKQMQVIMPMLSVVLLLLVPACLIVVFVRYHRKKKKKKERKLDAR